MKRETAEWVAKAEGDFQLASLAMRKRKGRKPLRDGICYHCQQCAEKYFKARLVEAGGDFPRTHDLQKLLQLVVLHEPLWQSLDRGAKFLTDCAVDFRYPGQTATEGEVKKAVKFCNTIRAEARHALGLK